MASKLLVSPSHPLSSLSSCSSSSSSFKTKASEFAGGRCSWLGVGRSPNSRRRPKLVGGVVSSLSFISMVDSILSSNYSSSSAAAAAAIAHHLISSHIPFPSMSSSSSPLFILAAVDNATAGYSLASYYTSLGLFVISIPGLWSLIKRSVKSKIVQKTYVIGEGEGRNAPNHVAGEILSFFTRNNFVVLDRGDTITFEGMMVPSRSQVALLTFCTCISLASVALVLTITLPEVGNNWFWLTLFSPLAGLYYWRRASRKEQIKVKMMVADDGALTEIIVQGDDQQVEQMRKELQLSEKGMVYVKGIFERS